MLTSLAALKAQLGIADSSQDAYWLPFIGDASGIARNFCKRWLGAVVNSISVASPTVITSYAHDLQDGDTVYFFRTNSTPKLDSSVYTITVIDDNTFSVPVNVTNAGTRGYILRAVTEYYCGNNRAALLLKQRPVWPTGLSVWRDQTGYWGQGTMNYDNPPFQQSSQVLVLGQDFILQTDGPNAAYSKSGMLIRLNAVWPQIVQRYQGLLATEPVPGVGNIKVSYLYGYMPVPADLQRTIVNMAVQLARSAAIGAPLKSEHNGYYDYQLADAGSSPGQSSGPKDPIGSNKRTLTRYREDAW